MRCPSCQRELPADARFCPACGTASTVGEQDRTRTSLSGAPESPAATGAGRSGDGARFTAGTVFADRYRIIGLLGRGGMGEVYRADDLKLGRTVALKFLPEHLERDPGRLSRFLNEVRTALSVTHPNVCRVHDVGEVAGRHFLSMEYVDGEDLQTLLRRIGRLPADRAVRAARQLCAALGAAHAQGVLHRDLKPANVMIDGRGEVKITDFGLAGAIGGFEGAEIRAGTPAYMAPEQREGREVTPRSDLYSLGLVLYELFSGKPAFAGNTPAEIARRGETRPTSLTSVVDGVDPAVARIVDRCLSTDPRDRPPSAIAVAAALPGGDPLAAALAAGETPSPELLAEAGSSEGLTPRQAWAVTLATLALIAVTVWIVSMVNLVSRVGLDRSPEVLRDRAQQILRDAGLGDATVDRVHAFEPNWDYYNHVRRSGRDPERWKLLGRIRPPGMLFQYRESPRLLARYASGSIGNWMGDPPFNVPGMVEVQLDPGGRLRSLSAVPKTGFGDVGPVEATDWAVLFDAAGLDIGQFQAAEPQYAPRRAFDERLAWTGRHPDVPDVELRVEAASYLDQLVVFTLVEPWSLPRETSPSKPSFLMRVAASMGPIWFGVSLIGLLFLAVRNVKLGRGDTRTALRLGLYLTVARLMWLFGAHHLPSGSEMEIIRSHLAHAGYRLILASVFYMALEPYARRLWPQMLVSWVRVFDGRLRDPRVGRDLLLGVAFGAAMASLTRGVAAVMLWTGSPGFPLVTDFWSWEGLRGFGPAIASLAGVHVTNVVETFMPIALFLIIRVLTRHTGVAIAVVTVSGLLMFNPGNGALVPFVIAFLLLAVIFWWALLRVGLLTAMVGFSVEPLLATPRLTTDVTAWHAVPMSMTFALVLGLVVWGLLAATRGQPLFRDEIQDRA